MTPPTDEPRTPATDPADRAAAEELTLLLNRVAGGADEPAHEQLMNRVYARLRAMAGRQARGHRASETLRPTALVHEAYMRLFGRGPQRFDSHQHFFAAAATVMRQIAVDHARRTGADKRGGSWSRTTLSGVTDRPDDDPALVLEIDEALETLAKLSERQARVVELRFFGGLSVEDTARCLDVSPRTVELDWRTARAFLRTTLSSAAAD